MHKQSDPKITIITAALNSAQTIGDALRSVASQTYQNVEHILIDGASSDNTIAVAEEHGKHLACVVSEPDEGLYDAMNKGLRLATGDLVGCLNADDLLANVDALRLVAHAAVSEGPADAVFGDLVYVRSNAPHRVVRSWRSGSYRASRLRFGWMPPHPTFYVRRGLVEKLGGYDTRFGIAADYDFMLRYLQHPNIQVQYVPEVLVKMRVGGASNRSLKALVRKSQEDLVAMRKNGVGSWFTLVCKNARKLPQFLSVIS
jgi:glycosyltransferase